MAGVGTKVICKKCRGPAEVVDEYLSLKEKIIFLIKCNQCRRTWEENKSSFEAKRTGYTAASGRRVSAEESRNPGKYHWRDFRDATAEFFGILDRRAQVKYGNVSVKEFIKFFKSAKIKVKKKMVGMNNFQWKLESEDKDTNFFLTLIQLLWHKGGLRTTNASRFCDELLDFFNDLVAAKDLESLFRLDSQVKEFATEHPDFLLAFKMAFEESQKGEEFQLAFQNNLDSIRKVFPSVNSH